MTPVMIEENEFVISFDISTGGIKLRNPHGKENDGNYVLLKELVKGLVMNTEKTVSVESEPANTEKPMSREELEEYHRQNLKNKIVKGSQFYKDMVEVKEVYNKLHKLGAPEGGFYRAIVWALERIDKEAEEPYSRA